MALAGCNPSVALWFKEVITTWAAKSLIGVGCSPASWARSATQPSRLNKPVTDRVIGRVTWRTCFLIASFSLLIRARYLAALTGTLRKYQKDLEDSDRTDCQLSSRSNLIITLELDSESTKGDGLVTCILYGALLIMFPSWDYPELAPRSSKKLPRCCKKTKDKRVGQVVQSEMISPNVRGVSGPQAGYFPLRLWIIRCWPNSHLNSKCMCFLTSKIKGKFLKPASFWGSCLTLLGLDSPPKSMGHPLHLMLLNKSRVLASVCHLLSRLDTLQKQMVLCFLWQNRQWKTIIHSFRPDLKNSCHQQQWKPSLLIMQLSLALFGFPRLALNQKDVIFSSYNSVFGAQKAIVYILHLNEKCWLGGTVFGCPGCMPGWDIPWFLCPPIRSFVGWPHMPPAPLAGSRDLLTWKSAAWGEERGLVLFIKILNQETLLVFSHSSTKISSLSCQVYLNKDRVKK